MTEYADDHVPANPKPLPLMLPPVLIPPEPQPPGPTRSEFLNAAIKAMRSCPKRERFAKAHKLENYALIAERFADEGDEEGAALRLAAEELRELAAALKE